MSGFGGPLSDPLERAATPSRIRGAGAAAGLPDPAIARGVAIAGMTPDATAWSVFLSRTLALLGVSLLLAGVVCAVAYNWARLGRFGKFALIEAAIVVAALAGWRLLPRVTGQLALFAAAVLVGPLLATYGQTYQTGADPYGLFLTWGLVIIPWVVAARFSLLWLLALGLFDLAMMLWWSQVVATDDLPALPAAIAALHGLALIGWEWQYGRDRWLDERWAAHVIAATGLTALTVGSAILIIEDIDAGIGGLASLLLLGGAILGFFHHYRRVRPDRLMLTLAGGTGMAVAAVAAARAIFDWFELGVAGFFVMALVLLAEIALGVRWFRKMSLTTGGATA